MLSGVIISQSITLLLSFLDKRHKKQILLRQKYEEMVFHFNESLLYPTEVDSCKTIDQIVSKIHNIPAMKAISLARLYIPDLEMPLENYIRKNMALFSETIDCFDPKIPADAGAQAAVKCGVPTPAHEELYQAKDAVLAAIRANAHKYTIA